MEMNELLENMGFSEKTCIVNWSALCALVDLKPELMVEAEAINELMDMVDCTILGQDYNNSAKDNMTGIEIFHNVM